MAQALGGQIDEPAGFAGPGESIFEQSPGDGRRVGAREDLDREGDLVAGAFGNLVDLGRDGEGSGGCDHVTAMAAAYDPGAGKEQAEIIMNFRDGAECATGRRVRLASENGDGRRQALHPLGVGFFQRFEKLAGVGGEGLDVPPLSLGIERVEGERAFPRPADSGDDDQGTHRQVEVNSLEVVGPNLAEADGFDKRRQRG